MSIKKNYAKATHIFNHEGTKHTDHVINVIKQVPEGGNHKHLPGVGDSRKFNVFGRGTIVKAI